MLNASTSGTMSLRTPREAIEIIENMVAIANKFQEDRAIVPSNRLLEVNTQDGILAKHKLLTRQMEELT